MAEGGTRDQFCVDKESTSRGQSWGKTRLHGWVCETDSKGKSLGGLYGRIRATDSKGKSLKLARVYGRIRATDGKSLAWVTVYITVSVWEDYMGGITVGVCKI